MRTPALRIISLRAAGRAAAALAIFLSLTAGQASAARPAVTVAEFEDGTRQGKGAKARAEIVKALQDGDKVVLVPWARVVEAGARSKVRGKALMQPETVGPLAGSVEANSVVLGAVRKAGKRYWLAIKVVNPAGRDLWSKEVELERGGVGQQLAAKFAAAIAAATGVDAGAAARAAPAEKVGRVEEAAAKAEVRKVEAYDQPDSGEERAVRPSNDGDEPEPTYLRERRSRRDVRDERDAEPRASVEGVPPLIDFTLGFTLSWRSYRWCPGVYDCEEPSPAGSGTPLRYSTGTPYGGVAVKADLFPLARNANRYLRGLGVGAGLNLSPSISTAYVDPATSERVELSSSQNAYRFDGIYRYYFGLSTFGLGWVGLRAGYNAYQFSIDQNPILTDSDRGGFVASLDVGVPIQSFLKLEARGALIPKAAPGEKERERYGVAASGGGFSGSVGLTSDLGHPEWHVGAGAFFDFAHFGDRYANYVGVQPEKGRSLEDYKALTIGVKASY